MRPALLTINGGSSSLKLALFAPGAPLARIMRGGVDRMAAQDAELHLTGDDGTALRERLAASDHAACIPPLAALLRKAALTVRAIGHRIVHGGMRFQAPERITPAVMDELRRSAEFAPQHVPAEMALIEACGTAFPDAAQVACFDTAFHAHLPPVAQLLPIPRRYAERGVRRYGFHGLSYEYLLQELQRSAGAAAARGRIILAHLGNGASMAAVRDGRCIDTTMAFTPAAGLVMGTRSGDLDPGLVAYLARADGFTPAQFDHMINAESGLLGLSETSADVRDLLARAGTDQRAAQALDVFCYQARKWIGALSAALGGLDTLVFAGGIGEHAPPIRARICAGLEHLGIALDATRNGENAAVISGAAGRVVVRVMATDEELTIARATAALVEP
jgi:acetate kinase